MTTMTGRRPALGHSSRTARKAPLPPRLGMYACTGQPHPFRPLVGKRFTGAIMPVWEGERTAS